MKKILIVSICLFVLGLSYLLFFESSDELFYVNQGAGMAPTLVNNQKVSGVAVEATLLKRGDIIVFTAPNFLPSNSSDRLIKRVIGLPGDTVLIENGSITITTESGETYDPKISPTPA